MGAFTDAISQCSSTMWKVRMAQIGYDWFSSTEVGQNIIESAKNHVNDAVQSYASKISVDEWNDRVLNASKINEDTPEEDIAAYSQAASDFKNILQESGDKWSNIIESVDSNPEQWGEYLSQRSGLTNDKLCEMFGNKETNGQGIEVAGMALDISVSDPNASALTKLSNKYLNKVNELVPDALSSNNDLEAEM